jgi:exodeoxyribonuclease V alpha subunit
VALRSEDHLLYLDRYWREERQVCDDLLAMLSTKPPIDEAALAAGLDRVFPAKGYDEQRDAARIALSQWITVLTGRPGTGKTTTVAALLALLAEQAELTGRARPRIALAAPTGKAAARLQEAVQIEIDKLGRADSARLQGLHATTLHRLLGSRPDTSSRFRHHRGNRLPYDVIVVDETSMVSLTMMARLLEAVRPDTRLVLVGDPDQLASVEAGAVLADLVDGLDDRDDARIAALQTSHRFGESIGALAAAIRDGDADRAVDVLQAGGEHIEWIDTPDATGPLREVLVAHALRLRQAAVLGDASAALNALDEHRLLCAHRRGPYGVQHWNRQAERWLTEATGEPIWSSWYTGRPVLVTATDYGLGLYNGDTGVTVAHDGVLRAVIAGTDQPLAFATSRLADVETMHAMTIHKSQGSQADEITVLLPPEESRLLTRELLYTAVTRAKRRVCVVGSQAEVRAAIGRRAVRATGLRERLRARSRW